MYGRVARLGLIVPSTNTTVEPELRAYLPAGVELFSTRVGVAEVAEEKDKVDSLLAMHDQLDRATAELASFGPDAIAYACTSGSFLNGRDSDEVMGEELSARYGLPVLTTSSCLVAGLHALSARRLAVATPYVAPVADGAASYFQQAGFEVTSRNDLHLLSNLDKGRLEPVAAYRAASALDVSDADAVVISCTNWRTIDVLTALELDLDRPAISSNLATLWALLRVVDIDVTYPSLRLMQHGLPEDVRRGWTSAAAGERAGV